MKPDPMRRGLRMRTPEGKKIFLYMSRNEQRKCGIMRLLSHSPLLTLSYAANDSCRISATSRWRCFRSDLSTTVCFAAASSPMSEGEKVYVGVRVRMPVKDLLQSIRRSQGDGAGRAEVRVLDPSPFPPRTDRSEQSSFLSHPCYFQRKL